MTLRVVQPGLMTTVQDLGRPGRQRFGVSVGGALDRLALRIGNWLVGNPEQFAGLEISLWGPTFDVERDVVVALCGGDFPWAADGIPLPLWRPVFLPAGMRITCGSATSGARGILAVAGGIQVPEVLGSRGTFMRAGLGGLEGRPLRAGDVVNIGSHPCPVRGSTLSHLRWSTWSASGWSDYVENRPLRVVLSHQFHELTSESQAQFLGGTFHVSQNSDRMGYRLTGQEIVWQQRPVEMLSTAVCSGTIQLPPHGELLVLLADCATTGGYPHVAYIASVDLPRVAQRKPGDLIRFEAISLAAAQHLRRQEEQELRQLQAGLRLKDVRLLT